MPDYNAPGYKLVVRFMEELKDKYSLGDLDSKYNNLFYSKKKATVIHARGSDTSKVFHNIDKPSIEYLKAQSVSGWKACIVLLSNSPHHGHWEWLPYALNQIDKKRWPYEGRSDSYKINHPNGVIGMKAFFTIEGFLGQSGLSSN